MILVDSSIWVEHFRSGHRSLSELLEAETVLTHPFVIGELACAQLRNRGEVLALLAKLPSARVAEHDDVLAFVALNRVHGRGIGWIDAHLLASALLSSAGLMTLDRPLSKLASIVGIAS